jgi:hypothetical protein
MKGDQDTSPGGEACGVLKKPIPTDDATSPTDEEICDLESAYSAYLA